MDALFGIGLSRAPEGVFEQVIRKINHSGAKVLSVDIPSGIDADIGEAPGTAVQADVTVSLAAYKRGHVLGDGVGHSGKVICADIGIGTDLFDADEQECPAYVIEERETVFDPQKKKRCQ